MGSHLYAFPSLPALYSQFVTVTLQCAPPDNRAPRGVSRCLSDMRSFIEGTCVNFNLTTLNTLAQKNRFGVVAIERLRHSS